MCKLEVKFISLNLEFKILIFKFTLYILTFITSIIGWFEVKLDI